jgi:hypothetical protein
MQRKVIFLEMISCSEFLLAACRSQQPNNDK